MKQKLFGMVFGQACGDAVGRYTEFLSECGVKSRYPTRESFHFPPNEYLVNNRTKIPNCHWTDDTDQMILLLEMLIETGNQVDIKIFAKKLKNWVENGKPEFGYTYGVGVGNLTLNIVNHRDFSDNPLSASKAVWQGVMAPNGSLMRTSILAFRFLSYEKTIEDAVIMSRCTHYDTRCSIAVSVIVSILWDLINGTDERYILDRAKKFCYDYPEHTTEAIKYFNMSSLNEAKLNEQIGYVFKCMMCGLYAFINRNKPYKEVILDIILQGGDADTNAAVAGAILGAHQGYNSLPQEWISKIPFKNWLEDKLEIYLKNFY